MKPTVIPTRKREHRITVYQGQNVITATAIKFTTAPPITMQIPYQTGKEIPKRLETSLFK
ncbi:hypothetical protein E2C01_063774 [Portunus trituberculatus]|uniref:Uncharacterized protein n=1 Tax=Portunus trituberculatus TaxID=210409 RepID=A0A5B7HI00_PORTR|nr:hypothetical protein [Portunus trituberculatus]